MAVGKDTADDQLPADGEHPLQVGCKFDQSRREDVGNDDVVAAINLAQRCRRDANPVGDAVADRVVARRRDCRRRDIDRVRV